MPESAVRRVLMTGDTVGGVWTFTLDLARALQTWNIEVTLAAMGGEPMKEQRAEAAAIPNLRLMVQPLQTGMDGRPVARRGGERPVGAGSGAELRAGRGSPEYFRTWLSPRCRRRFC